MPLKERVIYEFADFRLDVGERVLTRDGVALPIAPKAFDALVLLVENSGSLVERSAFRDRLWSGQLVEEATLARVISDLRRILGDTDGERRFIETVPKFGFRFVANVDVDSRGSSAELPSHADAAATELDPAAPAASSRGTIIKWVAVGAGLMIGLVAVMLAIRQRWTLPPVVPTLLIMPFQIVGDPAVVADPQAQMLQVGLEDSLAMELTALPQISVIKAAPQSNGGIDDPSELGRRRRAQYVLAGTAQLVSGRVKLDVTLLRGATGQALWTRSFEESSDDIFKLQSRLAKVTVAELVPALPRSDGARLERRFPSNGLAYRYYLLGRHYWNKRDDNSYAQALEMFQKASQADPTFAPAYVGLADTYLLATRPQQFLLKENLPMAEASIEKAIQLDADLGEAHATLAMIAGSYFFDWPKEERELRTAIRLSPSYATAHHWYAEFLSMMARFPEAEAAFETARNLDPASPIILTDLAQLYMFEKKYERSVETLNEVLKLDPSFHLAHDRKAYAMMMLHRPEQARQEIRIADVQAGRTPSLGVAAWVAAEEGKREEAAELARQSERIEQNPQLLSMVWAQLGDANRAMDYLERAYEMRSSGLISVKVNPVFDRLRNEERFRRLLSNMHFN